MSRRGGPLADPFAMASLGMAWWKLGLDSWQVIGLRSAVLMQGGPAAQAEAWRMVAEKWQVGMELGMLAMTGQAGGSPQVQSRRLARHYQKPVSANRRRLSR